MTLTEFLLARIAEDEEDAHAADGPRWFHSDKVVTFEAFGPDGDWVDASSPISVDTRANGWHIVRWSPTRVLAEVAAKRAIVALHHLDPDPDPADPCREDCRECGHVHPCPTLCALASVYADCPGYRDEWRLDPSA